MSRVSWHRDPGDCRMVSRRGRSAGGPGAGSLLGDRGRAAEGRR